MSRLMAIALLVGVMAGLSAVPMAFGTTITGEIVDISGLNDLNATADSQARTGLGKIFAYGLMAAGVGSLAAGYVMTGALAGGAGVAWAFVPRIINSAMDTAATAPLQGVVLSLSQSVQVSLGMLGLRLLQDPIFLVALISVVLLLRRQPRAQVA